MNKPCIINISGKAQHGKDTVCQLLIEELAKRQDAAIRIAYADYLKYLAKTVYGWNGVKDEAGRTLFQAIGDRVRERDPDFWVKIVELTASTVFDEKFVIIPDGRYPNELEYWEKKCYPTLNLKVVRPCFDNGLTPEQKQHSSETALDGYAFDQVLTNITLEGLREQVEKVVVALETVLKLKGEENARKGCN